MFSSLPRTGRGDAAAAAGVRALTLTTIGTRPPPRPTSIIVLRGARSLYHQKPPREPHAYYFLNLHEATADDNDPGQPVVHWRTWPRRVYVAIG
jgi:hypothetical protein